MREPRGEGSYLEDGLPGQKNVVKITMVSIFPSSKDGFFVGPLHFMTWFWLINEGGILTTYDTWEPILQVTPVVGGQKSLSMLQVWKIYLLFLLAKNQPFTRMSHWKLGSMVRILTFDPNFLKHPSGRS